MCFYHGGWWEWRWGRLRFIPQRPWEEGGEVVRGGVCVGGNGWGLIAYGFEAKLWTLGRHSAEVSLVGAVFQNHCLMFAAASQTMDLQCIADWIVIGQCCHTSRAVVINRLLGSVYLEALYFIRWCLLKQFEHLTWRDEIVRMEPKHGLQLSPRQGAWGRRGRWTIIKKKQSYLTIHLPIKRCFFPREERKWKTRRQRHQRG